MPASCYIAWSAALLAVLVLGGCAWPPSPQAQSSAPAAALDSTAGVVPTPTFVPVQAVQPPRFEGINPPTATAEAVPPASEPIAPPAPSEPDVLPTELPVAPLPTPLDVPSVPVVAGAQSVRLDDDVWYGGWKQGKTYGGRSATWIYGTATDYSAMEASFTLAYQPTANALLSIEGMDGEHAPKMQISILVNGITLWSGANPLPDDNFDLATGTWDTFSWTVPPELLQPGANTITIVALSEGSFGQPPFMMLDYADVYIGE